MNKPLRWKIQKLGNLGVFSKGQGIRKKEVRDSGLPCVRYGEIYTHYGTIIRDIKSFIDFETSKNSRKLSHGDILFAGSGETKEEIGKAAVFLGTDETYAGGDIVIFSPQEVNPIFLGYLVNSSAIVKQKMRMGKGDAVVHISSRDLSDIELLIPECSMEQKAIAEALSDIDELISVLKIEKKKLEQLLVGKLTFLFSPKFQTKYHFEDTTIDELASVIKGSARKYSDSYSTAMYPFVNGGIKPSGYTDSFNCESGAVLVSEGGNSCGFINFYKERVWSGGHSYRVQAKDESIRAEYLYYLLKFNESRIMGLRVGSGLPNVQAKDLKALSLIMCKDTSYQNLVIQELDDITSLIESSIQIIQEYEWLKLGMMNDLLTGKVRLV